MYCKLHVYWIQKYWIQIGIISIKFLVKTLYNIFFHGQNRRSFTNLIVIIPFNILGRNHGWWISSKTFCMITSGGNFFLFGKGFATYWNESLSNYLMATHTFIFIFGLCLFQIIFFRWVVAVLWIRNVVMGWNINFVIFTIITISGVRIGTTFIWI